MNRLMKSAFCAVLLCSRLALGPGAVELALGNEAFVDVAGGAVSLRAPDETEVELVSETVRIYLSAQEYVVDASFVFRNPGREERLQVGFPRYDYGTPEIAQFRDFRTWVNDLPVKATEIAAAPGGPAGVRSWYVKAVRFPEQELTTTRVRYRSGYGRDRLLRTVEYLYGTGRTWSGPIGHLRVQVFNSGALWVDSFQFAEPLPVAFFSLEANDFELIAADVEPRNDDVFRLAMERVPWWLSDGPSTPEKDWIFDRTEVKPESLRLLTLSQLRIFRNTFYARRGFDFCEGELGKFFRRFRWYKPYTTVAEGLLTPIEEENVRRIVAEEERRRTFIFR